MTPGYSWMKPRFAGLALCLSLLVVLGSSAVPDASAASKVDLAGEIVQILKWRTIHKLDVEIHLLVISEHATWTDTAAKAAFVEIYKRETDASVTPVLARIAKVYEDNFQGDELIQIAAFYKSDAGRRFCKFQTDLVILTLQVKINQLSPVEEVTRVNMFLTDPKLSYLKEVPNAASDKETLAFFQSHAGAQLFLKWQMVSVLSLGMSREAALEALRRSVPKPVTVRKP